MPTTIDRDTGRVTLALTAFGIKIVGRVTLVVTGMEVKAFMVNNQSVTISFEFKNSKTPGPRMHRDPNQPCLPQLKLSSYKRLTILQVCALNYFYSRVMVKPKLFTNLMAQLWNPQPLQILIKNNKSIKIYLAANWPSCYFCRCSQDVISCFSSCPFLHWK